MVANQSIDAISSLIANVKLPSTLQTTLLRELATAYDKGVVSIEQLINQNIIDTNPETLEFLQRYTFDLVKNMNKELADKLRTTLQLNILEGKSNTQIVGEIKDIFKTTITRAKAISRTETVRAYNVGQLEAARLSPIKLKKYYLAVLDERTSPICTRLSKKYSRDKAIPINRKFKDNLTGESWLTPPVHVGCRSEAVYITAE